MGDLSPRRQGPAQGHQQARGRTVQLPALSPRAPDPLPWGGQAQGIACTERSVHTVTSGKGNQSPCPILSISSVYTRISPKARLSPIEVGPTGPSYRVWG